MAEIEAGMMIRLVERGDARLDSLYAGKIGSVLGFHVYPHGKYAFINSDAKDQTRGAVIPFTAEWPIEKLVIIQ